MKQFLQLDKYVYLLDHDEKIYFLHSAHSSDIMKKKLYLEIYLNPRSVSLHCVLGQLKVSPSLSFFIYKMGSYHLPHKIPMMIE